MFNMTILDSNKPKIEKGKSVNQFDEIDIKDFSCKVKRYGEFLSAFSLRMSDV